MRALVITIDTEEEGRWSSSYPAHGNTCRNVELLGPIQRIFNRTGSIPTYLVDYPVAADPRARATLAQFAAQDRSEIGAHLHPWCNPPFDPADSTLRSATFPHNLPAHLQRSKLQRLCEAIQEGIGVRPTSYRAGRWGFNHTSVPVLERVGIQVDTSVVPLWWDGEPGGPVFARAPLHPYRLDPNDVCRPGRSAVVEVPTSNLVVGPHGRALERLVRLTGPAPGLRRFLRRLGLRSLRPEQHSLEAMRGLADTIAGRGLEVFNVMFHSSAALPGATPYVPDESALLSFCRRLEGILDYILSRHGATPLPLSRVPTFLGGSLLPEAGA